eukprot:Nk52_evm22s2485 gene=Nk52_evmTU22s2485
MSGNSGSSEGSKPQQSFQEILKAASGRAFRGGISGAGAMVIQVSSLMWLRTTMNYQYRYGTTTTQALKTLYKEGGIPRFYQGLTPALFQGPLSRFGDTAANSGMLALLESNESTRNLPVAAKTFCASGAAASWRIFLMPIDTWKTIKQVEGKDGLKKLGAKLKTSGPRVLYHGALAASAATFVGHFPWFFTYNFLNEKIPKETETVRKLARNAVIGFCASVVSDTCSNSIRVVKTYKQTSTVPVTYPQAVKNVVKQDGLAGLFGRGLKTRILANGMQGMMFAVLWKAIEEQLHKRGH